MRLTIKQDTTSQKELSHLAVFFAVTILIIITLEVWMVNRLSTFGKKIQQLKEIQANLHLENQVLENELAQNTSLLIVEEKAASLGFEPIKNITYYQPSIIAAVQ